ncbi:MAG: TolC family protein [Prevotella sp.]|nr:TolC family protein [Prevotella sp.]
MRELIGLIVIFYLSCCPTMAQNWTARQCMKYAVAHNTQVRQAELALDNYKTSRLEAIGSFLPSASAGVDVQYNFGRAINPETNGYTDVSTFYNGYYAHVSLPVFDGFSRIHALKAAKASILMGRHALREQQDQTALATLQAWVNVVYYEGMVAMVEEKQRETCLLLRQTEVMVEVGRKSRADLAQIEAQQAEVEYEMTRQSNLLASALLDLKRNMRFPLSDSIHCVCGKWQTDSVLALSLQVDAHPSVMQQYHAVETKRQEWLKTRSSLFPSLALSAGLSTTFYKTLHSQTTTAFNEQLRNNMGEYVTASLSIPLFNRLQTLTSMRRAKNNYLTAREVYEEKRLELEKLRREAWQDMVAYQKQTQQMRKKVEADSLAYQLTRRQYEEGLSTAIDVHTTSTQLLQSKATLLQCRLMTHLKHELVRYYNGETIWTE